MRRGLHGFAVWVWPLLALAGTFYAVFAVYRRHEFTAHEDNRIAVGIGLGYFFAAVAVTVFTQRWTLRGLGQLATYLCDGVFYTTLGGVGEFSRERLDALRAGFTVGVVALVVGVIWWAIRTRGGTRDPVNQPWVVPVTDPAPTPEQIDDRIIAEHYERRGSAPGRRASDWARSTTVAKEVEER